MDNNSIFSTFCRYVSVNVIAMIGLSCYILADTFFVSNGIGIDGLTALNLAIPLYSLINGVGLMIGVGGATKYAIYRAQKNETEADRVFTHAVISGLLAGMIILVIGILFSGHLSRMLGSDEVTYIMTNTYLKTIMCFAPMFILNNIWVAFMRNDGAPNLAMTAMLAGSISNIILDYIFIYPLKMGMFGAAFATGIAPVVSMLIMSGRFIKKKNGFHMVKCRISLLYIKAILLLGTSSLITEVSSGVVMILFNFVILGLEGNLGVAAYGVIANLALVATSIFTGISQGIQPIVSTEYGKGNKEGVRMTRKMAALTALIFAAVVYTVVLLFPAPIVEIFNRDHDQMLTLLAKEGLLVYFTGFFFSGINIIFAAFFGATEQPARSFIVSILRGVVILVPVLFILSAILGMRGVWLTYPVTELITWVIVFVIKNKQ